MSRIGAAMVAYLKDSARASSEGWDAFWFRPADPTLLGVIRILTGLMLVYTHAVWGLVLPDFFGETSWLNEPLVRAISTGAYRYSFWWLVPQGMIWPAHALSMVILVMFTVGFRSRITSVLSFLITVSYAYRAPAATFGLDQINAMLSLYLSIGPSGAALSVDRWLARRRGQVIGDRPEPSASANLALRLINVHMCVIYLFAGISKLQGEAWWNGEAMWRAFANYEYQTFDMTWMAWHPWLINLATHITIVWEISFVSLIWRPRWKPIVLLGGVVMHLGIGLCLGMWTFGLIMLVGCSSFLPTDAVGGMVAAMLRRRPRPEPVESPSYPAPVSRLPIRVEAMEPSLAGVADND